MVIHSKKSRLKKFSFLFLAAILLIFIIASINLFAQEGEQQQNSGGSISLDFNPIPSVTDLNFNRTFDKINITWNGKNSYATIRIDFYYAGDNKRYSVAQAQSFGARFDDWVVSSSGSSIKWGGIANVTGVSSTIKTNGFYPVFELIESQNADISKDGDKLWLGNDVYIEWKDYNNPSNIFKVWNKTTVYLTNNNELFHDTIIYDPAINVTVGTNWILNQSFLNTTAHPDWIEVNSSFSNGTSISPVTCNQSFIYYWNMSYGNFNTTEYIELSNVNGTCIQAKALQDRDNNEIAMSVRTKNISNFPEHKLLFALEFEDTALPVTEYTKLTASNIRSVVDGETADVSKDFKSGTFRSEFNVTGGWDNAGIRFYDSGTDTFGIGFDNLPNKYFNDSTEGYNPVNGTVTFWIKPENGGNTNQEVMEYFGAPGMILFRTDLGLINYGLRTDGTCTVVNKFSATPPIGVWSFIAIIKNETDIGWYQNGNWVDNHSCTGTIIKPTTQSCATATSACYWIGSSSTASAHNFSIDSYRIYKGALNKEELLAVMNEKNWTSFTSPQKASIPTANHRLQNISIAYETYAKPTGEAPPVLDTTKPIINGTLNKSITIIYQNDVINFTANFTDNSGNITWANFSINTSTKQYFNFSITGSSLTTRQISQNITITLAAGNVLNGTWVVSDNSSNLAQNDTTFTVASADTCTYSSGDWNIDITDNCIINTEVNGDVGSCVVFTGDSGTFTTNARVNRFSCVKYLTTNSKYAFNKGGIW